MCVRVCAFLCTSAKHFMANNVDIDLALLQILGQIVVDLLPIKFGYSSFAIFVDYICIKCLHVL